MKITRTPETQPFAAYSLNVLIETAKDRDLFIEVCNLAIRNGTNDRVIAAAYDLRTLA